MNVWGIIGLFLSKKFMEAQYNDLSSLEERPYIDFLAIL